MPHTQPEIGLPRPADEEIGTIPGSLAAAARYWSAENRSMPILLAVPHGGLFYPSDVTEQMRHPAQSSIRLEDRLIGLVGADAAHHSGTALLMADAPRAMIDLNRSVDDVDWDMIAGEKPSSPKFSSRNRRARAGLGLVPRRIAGIGEIWRGSVRREDLDRRIANIHRPYHGFVEAELRRLRDLHGAVLLFDLHSMPPLRPSNPGEAVAEFVVGDAYGAACDHCLTDAVLSRLSERGRRVAHNRPYAGGYMLERHGKPARGIHAIQLEVCRSLYLNAALDQPSARYPAIGRLIGGLLRDLAPLVASLGRSRGMLDAAE